MERKESKETGILESLVNQMFGKTIAQNNLEEVGHMSTSSKGNV